MKGLFFVIAMMVWAELGAGNLFNGWLCLSSSLVPKDQRSLIITAKSPVDGNICRSPLIPVEPGNDYIVTLQTVCELSAGELAMELRGYSGYNGTGESVRRVKMVSTINGAGMNGGLYSGKRTWRCAFTAPADATVFQIRLNAKKLKGRLTLKDWSISAGDTALKLPYLRKLPALEGKLPADFTRKALLLPDFLEFPQTEKMVPAKERTEAYLAASQTHLTAVFVLHHGQGQEWVAHDYERDSDGIGDDDSVELTISHVGGSSPLYRWVVNLNGGICDSMNGNKSWNSNILTKCGTVNKNDRLIQMLIPLQDIGFVPDVDDMVVDPYWKINIRRNHAKSNVRPAASHSSAAPLKEAQDLSRFLAIRRTGNAEQTVYTPLLHAEAGLALREKKERLFRPEKPLCEELYSDEKPPLSGMGGICWYHPYDPCMYLWALQYGIRWSTQEWDRIFIQNKLHPWMMYDVMNDWAQGALNSPDSKALLCAPFWVSNERGLDWSIPHSPYARKKMIDQLRGYIEKRPGQIWAVSLGDEILYRFAPVLLQRASDPILRDKDPEIREMVRCITEKYGFGKYGPPSAVSAREPLNFLAFHKYVNAQFQLATRELRAMLDEHEKKTGEKIYILAHDPTGYTPDENASRWGDSADFVTLQTAPMNNPERQYIAFTCQLLGDITGKPVWPVIHLESYLGYYTPEDVCLAVSEAARGGATGFHLFDHDTRGNLAKSGNTHLCYYGHKPRWDAIMAYMEKLRTMPKLKFPKPGFGILFSTDTELSQRTYDMIAYEMVYNCACPGAGARCKFFDDDQLEDGKVDLKQWPLIIVPDAPIERSAVPKALLEYLKNGGTVLCFDPQAFETDVNLKVV